MSGSVWYLFSLKAIFLCILVAQYLPTSIGAPVLETTDHPGLYPLTDNVTFLDSANFTKTIYTNETGWFVEFYADWCGDCRRYAPIWRDLYTSVVEWQSVVKVAVINCADPKNKHLCSEHYIRNYPTVKYFAASLITEAQGLRMPEVEDALILRENLVRQLQVEQLEGRGTPKWPNLEPFEGPEVKDVWKNVRDAVKYIFLIVEDPSSVLGSDVILDFNEMTSLLIRRVISGNETVKLSPKIDNFPALIAFDRDNTENLLNITEPTRQGLRNVIKKFMMSKNLSIDIGDVPQVPKTPKPEVTTTPKSIIAEANVVHQEDLGLALRDSIRQEIAQVKEINAESMTALKNYINALAKYFPVRRGNDTFLGALNSALNSTETISGEDFGKLVKSLEDKSSPVYQAEGSHWIGCKGSNPNLRGYTCGLWQLFHTLTVNFAVENAGLGNVKANQVLEDIYGYMKHFFGCRGCSRHFLEMAERRKMADVTNPDDNILWLWEAHNEVNQRLKSDSTEDPKHPKIQFPSQNDCPTCRDEHQQWDRKEVLKFLKKLYPNSGNVNGNSNDSTLIQKLGTLKKMLQSVVDYISLLI